MLFLRGLSIDYSVKWSDYRPAGEVLFRVHPSSAKEMAGSTGFEPATSCVTGRRSNQLNYDPNVLNGGRYRTRTCDSRRVKPVLYQLS
jgi:hypothetical protein